MVERYAHANGTHIQDAMDKLENRLNISDDSGQSVPTLVPDYTETTQMEKTKGAASLQPLEFW